MARFPLSCTVRGCGLPLERDGAAYTCPQEHRFDVARRGYVNLLQPQDRRSLAAGDTKGAVEARARLLAAGVGRAVLETFAERAAALVTAKDETVADLGCGSGDALAALAHRRPIAGVGIDLSAAAVEQAARRFPDLLWVVANADRRLPLLDASVAMILSLHARRNAAECARVLAPGGHLLVAVPAHDDLVELRASIMGQHLERDRATLLLAEHDPFFVLAERSSIRERQQLDRAALLDLLRGTYRGARSSAADRIAALDSLTVTIASELFLFRPRS